MHPTLLAALPLGAQAALNSPPGILPPHCTELNWKPQPRTRHPPFATILLSIPEKKSDSLVDQDNSNQTHLWVQNSGPFLNFGCSTFLTKLASMAQPKLQAPFIPGQKEAADLMNEVTSEQKMPPPSDVENDEHEQRGEASGTVVSGVGLVEVGKGMASEVGESLVSIRGRVMETLAGLQLPSETLDAVKRTFETGLKGTKDAVQRTQKSFRDILPSSLSSESDDHEVRQVVEDMESHMLAHSEGSGEDLSQVSEGPKDDALSASETSTPTFMRAKL